ncbi:MAG: NAD(P)H-binding protein [Segetibacter sp.]
MTTKPILITGATGYIGGRLVPQLLAKGYRIRCVTRDPNRPRGRGWEDRVEVIAGDVLDPGSLGPAMEGCGAAYYLVHSMAGGEGSFRERDLQAARNFATAAAAAGLERVIYLGGLGRRSERLSKHLSSRHEVGDALRAGSVPTTELRAAMIIGSGSASFEMLRALVCRLPVMVCGCALQPARLCSSWMIIRILWMARGDAVGVTAGSPPSVGGPWPPRPRSRRHPRDGRCRTTARRPPADR